MTINYEYLAVEAADAIKYDTSVNEIERKGSLILQVPKGECNIAGITSVRSVVLIQYIMGLKIAKLPEEESIKRLRFFLTSLGGQVQADNLMRILSAACHDDNKNSAIKRSTIVDFLGFGFHGQVVKHSRDLFISEKYFHAVFESAKAYNNAVKEKSKSTKDGQDLMLSVWSPEKGVLKLNECDTESKRNVHDGVKFLSAGLTQAIRNPIAHETAIDWPIERQDCIDILHFISYLFRNLDKSTYIGQ